MIIFIDDIVSRGRVASKKYYILAVRALFFKLQNVIIASQKGRKVT